MTADDFFLLFVAFGGLVVVPALLLWGFARLTQRTQSGSRGPGIPPDAGAPGTSNGDERNETVRSGQADNVLRRFAGWTRHGVASSS